MDDLIAWLRTQLDDDERVARAAARDTGFGDRGYAWRSATDDGNVMPADMRGHDWIAIGPWSTGLGVAVGAHIARHDPARIVRDVEAKRRILDEVPCTDYLGDASVCRRTVKLLALPYADRPGFRDEWRPFLP